MLVQNGELPYALRARRVCVLCLLSQDRPPLPPALHIPTTYIHAPTELRDADPVSTVKRDAGVWGVGTHIFFVSFKFSTTAHTWNTHLLDLYTHPEPRRAAPPAAKWALTRGAPPCHRPPLAAMPLCSRLSCTSCTPWPDRRSGRCTRRCRGCGQCCSRRASGSPSSR